MVTCYPSAGKRKALKICTYFAEGCGGTVVGTNDPHLRRGAAFFYGWTKHTILLIRQCQAEDRTWYYADNAYYFGRGRYFRVTKNALMHDGSGRAGPDRFGRFDLGIRPWRVGGDRVIVATQSELFYTQRLGIGRDEWTRQVVAALERHTDREIVICHKPAAPWHGPTPHINFELAVPDAWAVVSHSSSVMVKAMLEGVPVFSLGPSMASHMGLGDPAMIEQPLYPDGRAPWLWNLAANQWTREELRDGTCWRELSPMPDAGCRMSDDGCRVPGAGPHAPDVG